MNVERITNATNNFMKAAFSYPQSFAPKLYYGSTHEIDDNFNKGIKYCGDAYTLAQSLLSPHIDEDDISFSPEAIEYVKRATGFDISDHKFNKCLRLVLCINEMVRHLIISIECGNTDAMYLLGMYYKHFEYYTQMEHYFIMAAENDNKSAALELAKYYYNITKNYSGVKKYLNIVAGYTSDTARINMYIELYVISSTYNELSNIFNTIVDAYKHVSLP